MKKRLYVILAAAVLLMIVMLPILPAASSGVHIRQTANEHVARLGPEAKCQSGFACGG